jgi:cytochrome c553
MIEAATMTSDRRRTDTIAALTIAVLVGTLGLGAEASPSLPMVAHGATSPELERRKEELEKMLDTLARNQNKFERFMAEGRIRTTLCRKCHGADGVSLMPGVPSLAGQDPVYLLEQFDRFADGRRDDFLMSGLAKSLSDRDKLRIAVYYASLPPAQTVAGDWKLLTRGEVVYKSACIGCHGPDGRSELGYARLAGQRPDYVAKRLREFRARAREGGGSEMAAQSGGLSDEDIEAVAAYTANLP